MLQEVHFQYRRPIHDVRRYSKTKCLIYESIGALRALGLVRRLYDEIGPSKLMQGLRNVEFGSVQVTN